MGCASINFKMNSQNESIDKLLGIGGVTLVCRVIDLFFEHVPPKLTQLQAQLAGGNFQELERIAHSIKSSAANLGLEALRQHAEALESHTRESEPQHAVCTKDVEAILAAYEDTAPFLRQKRSELDCP